VNTLGTGNEAGNKKDYLIGMSVCYPQPGSIKIQDRKLLTIESRYKNKFGIGGMRYFYIYLADDLSQEY